LSGALFAQSQGFADITMGMGTIIVGLASVIIGEALFHPRSILFALIACTLGSIIYRLAIALALNSHYIGLQASDLNLVTALLVAVTMILPKIKKTKHGGSDD
jgi:putative ABC transport system permease protein